MSSPDTSVGLMVSRCVEATKPPSASNEITHAAIHLRCQKKDLTITHPLLPVLPCPRMESLQSHLFYDFGGDVERRIEPHKRSGVEIEDQLNPSALHNLFERRLEFEGERILDVTLDAQQLGLCVFNEPLRIQSELFQLLGSLTLRIFVEHAQAALEAFLLGLQCF